MKTTPIDLSQLPAPDIVDTLDYETIFAQRKARLIGLFPAKEQAEIAATLALESEPMTRLLQENAYLQMLLLALINEKARGLLLAYARRTTLEHLAALFDVERLLIDPGNPDKHIAPTWEDDDSLRERVQMAPRGFSVAGPLDAYRFHSRSADGRILSTDAYSPDPCVMVVTILSRLGDGTASADLIEAVRSALESTRPQAEEVIIRSAQIVRYSIRATLRFFSGPDRSVALAEAKKRATAFADKMRRIGMEITVDGLHAAIRVAGVQKVILESPADGVPITRDQASYCTGIELIDGGVAND